MPKMGFLGCGNMGSALVRSVCGQNIEDTQLLIFDIDHVKTEALARETGAGVADTQTDLFAKSEVVVLAVKPNQMAASLKGLEQTARNKLVISIAAGISLHHLAALLPLSRLIRVMPNTPAQLGVGVIAYSPDTNCSDADTTLFATLFKGAGRLFPVEEKLMDAVTGLSGSGPAYVFAAINALAEGGVREGIPKAMALPMAAQTFLGAARMVLESGEHPELLKDRVTSPGGTTAAGLARLEKGGLRSLLIEAVCAAAARSRELGQ